MSVHQIRPNLDHWQERVDLAAAFRWTERLNLHEAVSNHFSLAVNEDGNEFLMNPNQVHFSRIKASELLHLDAKDPNTLDKPDAPDATAWGLHGALHRNVPHARCAMHVHSIHATVLASLADSRLPAIDQNTAIFYDRVVIDENFGGLAFEEEGERCAALFSDPKKKVMVMGNHGIMVIGATVAETFNRMYFFERACETYIRALQTGQPLRYIPDDSAASVADDIEEYDNQDVRHLTELKLILDDEGSTYAT